MLYLDEFLHGSLNSELDSSQNDHHNRRHQECLETNTCHECKLFEHGFDKREVLVVFHEQNDHQNAYHECQCAYYSVKRISNEFLVRQESEDSDLIWPIQVGDAIDSISYSFHKEKDDIGNEGDRVGVENIDAVGEDPLKDLFGSECHN